MNPTTKFKNLAVVQTALLWPCLAALALVLIVPARAQTNVMPARTNMVADLTEASLLSAMAGGGTVTFACSGTIRLENTVFIGADTVLDGSGQQVTISGGNSVEVFYINPYATLTLENLTIADGWGTNGGGIYNDYEGTLNATNCHFVL